MYRSFVDYQSEDVYDLGFSMVSNENEMLGLENEDAELDEMYYMRARSGEVIEKNIGDVEDDDAFKLRGAKKYMMMAKRCCEIYHCDIDAKGILFLDEQKGVYERPDPKRLEQLILQSLSDAERDTLPPEKGVRNIVAKMEHLLLNTTGHDVSEVLQANLQEGFINLKNGVLELLPQAEPTLHHHNLNLVKENRFSYCLNANYVPKIERTGTPNFDSFLQTSFLEEAEEARIVVLQFLGYILGNSTKGKCILVFVGQPNSGKTVIMQLVEAIVPAKNRSNIRLQDLGNPIKVAELEGKIVNMQSELGSDKLPNIEVLKALSSGDTVLGEKKFQAPFSFRNGATLVCFSNTFPKPRNMDPSDGFYNRLKMLYFPRSVPPEERDPDLLNKLLREKDAIVSEALECYGELLGNNFLFADTWSSHNYLKMYRCMLNSFQLFLDSEVIIASDLKVHTRVLEERYKHFCVENGLESIKKSNLKEILLGMPGVEYAKFSINGHCCWGFRGIGLK